MGPRWSGTGTLVLTAHPHPLTLTCTVLDLIDSGELTLIFCGLVAAVFAIGWRHLQSERNHLTALNRYIVMKHRLGHPVEIKSIARGVVDDITRVERARDPVRRQTDIDALWKRAVRLEGSVVFWVDLLQKLGLLGTVLGLGFALALDRGRATDLLEPLSMAVWTTVLGLLGSIAISWKFGRDVDVEVDVHEAHLAEWQHALRAGDDAGMGAPAGHGPDEGPANNLENGRENDPDRLARPSGQRPER